MLLIPFFISNNLQTFWNLLKKTTSFYPKIFLSYRTSPPFYLPVAEKPCYQGAGAKEDFYYLLCGKKKLLTIVISQGSIVRKNKECRIRNFLCNISLFSSAFN